MGQEIWRDWPDWTVFGLLRTCYTAIGVKKQVRAWTALWGCFVLTRDCWTQPKRPHHHLQVKCKELIWTPHPHRYCEFLCLSIFPSCRQSYLGWLQAPSGLSFVLLPFSSRQSLLRGCELLVLLPEISLEGDSFRFLVFYQPGGCQRAGSWQWLGDPGVNGHKGQMRMKNEMYVRREGTSDMEDSTLQEASSTCPPGAPH